ncbi:hypothetical protein [Staphylococcus americanisciuri]|uniref:Maebl n=1 Tax=Staphylococcus americanisciuri TaxID=2973940 RepID=A0ABT2EYQ4_9STAP|nr:hypothetical protein [Staphylococcus americanisciuri]MCS4485324.1 hypothetical protein [Staphylococcus americanisciuri]
MEKNEQTQQIHVNDQNNLDFALSFIAGTLIGSAIGYAVKPFVTQAIHYTKKHELTDVTKQTQQIRQEAVRKAEAIKAKAQQIKAEALHQNANKKEASSVAEREAQLRAIRNEVDSDKLEAPTKPTYHFSDTKDQPVDLSSLKARKQVLNNSVEEAPVENSAKEEVPVSSLAAIRQALEVDKQREEVSEEILVEKQKPVESKIQEATVEQRIPQTHQEAWFDNGVITHDKPSQTKPMSGRKKATKTPKKKTQQSAKKRGTSKKTTQLAAKAPSQKTTAPKAQVKQGQSKKRQPKNHQQTAKKTTNKVDKHTFNSNK